jgi:hypothetical protein
VSIAVDTPWRDLRFSLGSPQALTASHDFLASQLKINRLIVRYDKALGFLQSRDRPIQEIFVGLRLRQEPVESPDE